MIEKLNSVQAFTGSKAHKCEKCLPENTNKQQPKCVVVSKDGAKAMRNYAMAMIGALGLSTTVPTLTSCEQEPDIEFNHKDSTSVRVDYHPLPLKPDTHIVYKDRIVKDTVWQTKTDTVQLPGKDSIVYVKVPEYLPGDTIRDTIRVEVPVEVPGETVHDTTFVYLPGEEVHDTIWQEKRDTVFLPGKDSLIYVPYPEYLPGDTIRDTIRVEVPGETVYLEPDYKSEAADSLIAHGKNLGFKFDGEGNVPTRINVFDQWNSTNHDMVLDGKASSEEKMVFIDQAKDYSQNIDVPEVRYNRIEFSVDHGRGVTSHMFKSPTIGVKPSSVASWIEAAKTCNTNYKDGFIGIHKYEPHGGLTKVGTFEKSQETDVDFYHNLFTEDGYVDSYSMTEAKMTLGNPKK